MSEPIKVSAMARIYARAIIADLREFDMIKEDLKPQVSQALSELGYDENGVKLEESTEELAGE